MSAKNRKIQHIFSRFKLLLCFLCRAHFAVLLFFSPFSVRALRCNCLISFELFRSVRLHNTFGFLILSHFDSLSLPPLLFFLPHWQVWAQLIPIESWLARLVKWHFVQSHTTAPVQHILLFVLCCCRAFPADLYEKHDNCSWWIYDWSRTSRREFQEEYLQTYFFSIHNRARLSTVLCAVIVFYFHRCCLPFNCHLACRYF